VKRLFFLREKIICRQVLEQQLVQQERRQQQERHPLERLQVLVRRQVLELALLLLFYRKRLKLLQRELRVRGRVISSFERSLNIEQQVVLTRIWLENGTGFPVNRSL
jgi:hypothetical protein